MNFDPTAFMSGQVGSKIWLCEKIEPIISHLFDREVDIWVLGGWYGMTPFLLNARRRAPIHRITSYDIDPQATAGAMTLNEAFVHSTLFMAETADANCLEYGNPDIVINTSTEHMESSEWFDRIPKGTVCVFQSNNMDHDDHVRKCVSTDDLCQQYPLERTLYLGSKMFNYPEWSFTRFMHIGVK